MSKDTRCRLVRTASAVDEAAVATAAATVVSPRRLGLSPDADEPAPITRWGEATRYVARVLRVCKVRRDALLAITSQRSPHYDDGKPGCSCISPHYSRRGRCGDCAR